MSPRHPPSQSPVMDFITFRFMITPLVISFIFWVGTMVCLAVGFRIAVGSFDAGDRGARETERERDIPLKKADKLEKQERPSNFSALQLAYGLAVMVFGPLILRIMCELDIILFSIHDELKEANDRAKYKT